MPSEEFHRIMADLREREKRLYDNLAALEEEGRAVVRDHRELLVAIENDQGPTRPPQHPVTEALNAFHSTQIVEPPAVASGAEAQPVQDEDSLFIPGESGESRRVSGNAEESLFISESAEDALPSPQHAKNSLSVPEDTRIEEPTADPRPRPKRRVTFSDAPDTIFGAMSPSANFGSGDAANTDEPLPVQSPAGDAQIGDNEPVNTGCTPAVTKHDHVKATQESLRPPVTSDDTNMSFEEPVYNAFATIASEDDHVNAARESPTLPINADDTMTGFDQPIYAGNRRPVKRVGHSSRTSILMHNTGFTSILPENKPASDPQGLTSTYNHQNLVKNYNAQNLAGTFNPQDFNNNYNSQHLGDTYDPQDYISNYDPHIPADRPIEPWQGEQYNDMTAESKLPDHVDSHFVCPYPDCGKLYVNSVDVEQHLKHHHPDWALIKDAVNAPDTSKVLDFPKN
ncbi:hypothetical protein KCU95_g711, partial [Aureobasidium melanogenum]